MILSFQRKRTVRFYLKRRVHVRTFPGTVPTFFFAEISNPKLWSARNEVIVNRVMIYANPLLIAQPVNYTESVLHICFLFFDFCLFDSGLTYSISILVNGCKCTVQLTKHTGRELSSPLSARLYYEYYEYIVNSNNFG